MATSGKSEYKTRNWVTVMYPDSAPEGWRDTLREWCVQAFVSPLHDQDKDPTGEAKKPHWHVLILWDGPKPRAYVEKRVEELGGVGCQPCNSARGYARYLCHLDNPDKAQYDPANVECFGGADYLEVIALPGERRKLVGEMMDWCRENQITQYVDLADYAKANREDWFRTLVDNSTMVMYRYLRSLEDKLQKEAEREAKAEAKARAEAIGQMVQQEAAEAKARAKEAERLDPLTARYRGAVDCGGLDSSQY